MKINLDILVEQYLDDFFENIGPELILEYAREQLKVNLLDRSEQDVIATIDEFYNDFKSKPAAPVPIMPSLAGIILCQNSS